MSNIKHRPTLSAPPSYSVPSPQPRRPQIWQKLASGQTRIVAILLLGTSIFLALQSAFGQLSRPRFQHLDTFPRKIWQSWKTDPLRFEDRDIKRARSWTGLNPTHRYEVLTDQNALPWVELHFGPSGFNRPDIVNTYKALENNLKIVQADLLRYLIMYVEGGVWTDIDVQAIKPIDSFIPKGFEEQEIQMVIGIETDEPDFKDHPVLGSKAQSFCQWTFMCKPRLPVMLKLIDNIQIWLAELAYEQGKDISDLHLGFDEVLSGTGPSAFTNAILKQMSKDIGKAVTWMDKFHDMTDSILVGGILVLPAEAFAAGTGHSQSGNHGSRRALVKHHFHASSWTTRHPRQKHPIYGEVERCNWDMECIRLWDANTAFYSSLPEKEQQRMIGVKRLHEAQAEEFAQLGSVQVPLGAAKDVGPPDLAAIARFLGQKVEESSKSEDSPPGPDHEQKSETKLSDETKQDAAIDLAAIARFLGQKVEELPAEEEKPSVGTKPDEGKKEDVPIDLAAIARYLGQAVEELPAESGEKSVADTAAKGGAAIKDDVPVLPPMPLENAEEKAVKKEIETADEGKLASGLTSAESTIKGSKSEVDRKEIQSEKVRQVSEGVEDALDVEDDYDIDFEEEPDDDESQFDIEDDLPDSEEPDDGSDMGVGAETKSHENQRSMLSRLWSN